MLTTLEDAYADASWFARFLVRARPIICPMGPIIQRVPRDSTVLDVGCGAGALLIELCLEGRVSKGLGCDVNSRAIAVASRAAARAGTSQATFAVLGPAAKLPDQEFEVVTLIDVMHHVSPARQRDFFASCAARVARGGRMIYKDMAERPRWKNWFNRLHDAVLARQLINYVPLASIREWGAAAGLAIHDERAYSRGPYQHELIEFRRPSGR